MSLVVVMTRLPDEFDMSDPVTRVRWWALSLAILLGLGPGQFTTPVRLRTHR